MVAFLKGLEIYDAWFARISLLFKGACLFDVLKNISWNISHDVIFFFAKIYFNSSLSLTESFLIAPIKGSIVFWTTYM